MLLLPQVRPAGTDCRYMGGKHTHTHTPEQQRSSRSSAEHVTLCQFQPAH